MHRSSLLTLFDSTTNVQCCLLLSRHKSYCISLIHLATTFSPVRFSAAVIWVQYLTAVYVRCSTLYRQVHCTGEILVMSPTPMTWVGIIKRVRTIPPKCEINFPPQKSRKQEKTGDQCQLVYQSRPSLTLQKSHFSGVWEMVTLQKSHLWEMSWLDRLAVNCTADGISLT